MRMNWIVRGTATALLLCSPGCGGGGGAPAVSSSMEEATVRGTVTLNGKPPVAAKVYFDPSNVHRKVGANSADVRPDGTYEVKTLVGGNRVSVHNRVIDADMALSTNSRPVEVQSGENTVAIELP